MHDQSISQAEIDALVRGVTGAMSEPEPPAGPAGGPGESQLLRDPLRDFAIQAGHALSELVGSPCQGSLAELTDTTMQGVSGLISGQLLVAKIQLTTGLNGHVYYVLPLTLGLSMITQIYGGIAPSALDDSAIAALSDGLTQMNASGLTRLVEFMGTPAFAGPAEVVPATAITDLAGVQPGQSVAAAAIDVMVGEESGRMYLVLPPEISGPIAQAAKLRQAGRSAAAAPAIAAAAAALAAPAQAPAPKPAAPAAASTGFQTPAFPEIAPRVAATRAEEIRNIDLLLDVNLQVTVELGRTRKQIRDVLSLGPGSVLELDKLAGEQVDVLVNGKLIAKGEVVVIDENYGVRITDIISQVERVQSLR